MGRSTVREIVLETCEIIWKQLSPIYVAEPTAQDNIKIIQNFWNRWNMPNCLGAIDGKHDVDAYGFQSDGGNFNNSISIRLYIYLHKIL